MAMQMMNDTRHLVDDNNDAVRRHMRLIDRIKGLPDSVGHTASDVRCIINMNGSGILGRISTTGDISLEDENVVAHNVLEMKRGSSNIGFYARQGIEEGELLVASEPLAFVTKQDSSKFENELKRSLKGRSKVSQSLVEDDNDNDEDVLTCALILEVTKRLTESLAASSCQRLTTSDSNTFLERLLDLYPRTEKEVQHLERGVSRKWTSHNLLTDSYLDKRLSELTAPLGLRFRKGQIFGTLVGPYKRLEARLVPLFGRLKWVVSLNCLLIHQFPDLISYKAKFEFLDACGLFFYPSFFNHSCRPNVTRYSVGTKTYFRTNRPVSVLEELTISYIESEFLPEPRDIRMKALCRDFLCNCDKCQSDMGEPITSCENGKASSERLQIFSDELESVMSQMDPFNRIQLLNEIPAIPKIAELSSDQFFAEEVHKGPYLLRDVMKLHTYRAIAYEHSGNLEEAAEEFRTLMCLALLYLPPNDEAFVCFAVHAAKCLLGVGSHSKAMSVLIMAKRVHQVCFGGGDRWFALRYETDIRGQYLPAGEASEASNHASQEILGLLGHPAVSRQTRQKKAFWKIRRLKRSVKGRLVVDYRFFGGMTDGRCKAKDFLKH